MAAARKLDSLYGGNRAGRQQSPPATGGGWGGHTISKSFTQLAWDGYNDTDGATGQQDLRESLGPNNTFVTNTLVKDKYVGTGHGVGIHQPPPMRSYSTGDSVKPGQALQQRHQMGLRQWDTIDLAADNTGTTSTRGSGSLQRGNTRGDDRMQRELTRSVTYGGVDSFRNQQVDRNMYERSTVHVDEALRPGPVPRYQHTDRNIHQRSSMHGEEPPLPPRAGGSDHMYAPPRQLQSHNSPEVHRASRMVQENQLQMHQSRPRQEMEMGGFDNREIMRQSTTVDGRQAEVSRESRIIPEPSRQLAPLRASQEMGSLDRRSQLISESAVQHHVVATPAVGKSNSGGWQSHWKIRDPPLLRRHQQVSSTIDDIDLHIYDYMRHFKQDELDSILLKCQLVCNVTMKFMTQSNDENNAVRNMFHALYKKIQEHIWIEEFDISAVNDAKDLKTELENKFAVLVYLTGHHKLQVVSDKNNMNNITNLINKAGGMSMHHPGVQHETLVQVHASPTENKVVASVNFPPRGYLVYGMVKVYLHLCDITKMHVDVVVNAANQYMEHHGGIARAISAAAGSELEAACASIIQRGGPVPTTQVIRTNSGDMPCKYVLHAVGPRWPEQEDRYKNEQCLRELRGTFDNVLGSVFETGMETIALPPISSGIFGVPGDLVSETMFAAIITAVQKYFFHEDNNLKEIHIVDLKSDILRHLSGLFENSRESRGPDIIRLLSDSDVQLRTSCIFSPRERMLPQMRQLEQRTISHSSILGSNNELRFDPRGYQVTGNINVIVNMVDITRMNVDTIINPTDEYLNKRNNVSKAIAMAAGPNYDRALEDMIQSKGPLQTGQVKRTSPGRLPCETVLHLAGPHEPTQDKYKQEQCIRDVQIGFNNVIDYACRSGVESIAVPLSPGMFMVPEKYVVDALHEAIIYYLQDIYFASTNLRTIHVVDTRPELLIDILHHFDNDMRRPGPRGGAVATLNRRELDTSIQQSITPAYPPKLVSQMHGIVQNDREALRRDDNRFQKWGSDQHLNRSAGWESSSEADRRSDPGTYQRKKGKKRVVVTKRKTWSSKKSSGSSQQSSQNRSTSQKPKSKSNPLDCFKIGKSSPKHEMTIEHPHYDDDAEIEWTNRSAPPLSSTNYHNERYVGSQQVNRGYVDHVESRNPPMTSQPRSQSYHEYPPDRMSRELQYNRTPAPHDYHRETLDRPRNLQY